MGCVHCQIYKKKVCKNPIHPVNGFCHRGIYCSYRHPKIKGSAIASTQEGVSRTLNEGISSADSHTNGSNIQVHNSIPGIEINNKENYSGKQQIVHLLRDKCKINKNQSSGKHFWQDMQKSTFCTCSSGRSR